MKGQSPSLPAKTVVAMHDLSSVGRCALTVAIPVLAAMGLQPIPAPTAVLSAHTAFPEFAALDLTDYLESCLHEWGQMRLSFDCVYTGYLASTRQAEIARRFIESQPNAKIIVDPVLGDDGQMYRALPSEMPDAMRALCASADLITPNLTEAALLTGESASGAISESALEKMLVRLRGLGAKTALITGVALQADIQASSSEVRATEGDDRRNASNAFKMRPASAPPLGTRVDDFSARHVNAWMGADGKMHMLEYAPVNAAFPGTGDLFASVVAGALTLGKPLERAIAIATEYTRLSMIHTVNCGTTPVYGVQLEQTLESLMQMLS